MALPLLTKAELSVDHYAVLEISPTASSKEIRQSYRHLARAFHPDKTQAQPHSASKRNSSDHFQRVNQAKEILLDESKRRFYDRNRIHSNSNASSTSSQRRTTKSSTSTRQNINKHPKASTVIRPKSGLTFHQARRSHHHQQTQPLSKSVQNNEASASQSSSFAAHKDEQQKDRLKNLFLKQQRAQKQRRRVSASSASVASAPASLRTTRKSPVLHSAKVPHTPMDTRQGKKPETYYTPSPTYTTTSTVTSSSEEDYRHPSSSFHMPSNSAPFKGQGAACILQAFNPLSATERSKQRQERGRSRSRHESGLEKEEESEDNHSTFSSNHESTEGSDHEHDFVQDYFPSSTFEQSLQAVSNHSTKAEDVIFPRQSRQQRLLFGSKPKASTHQIRAASLPPQRSKPKARAAFFMPSKVKSNHPASSAASTSAANVVFGFTRKQLPCRICLQLGHYCQYHAHQQHDAHYQELRKRYKKQHMSDMSPPLSAGETKIFHNRSVLGILPNGKPCPACLQRQDFCVAHAAQKHRPCAYASAKQ